MSEFTDKISSLNITLKSTLLAEFDLQRFEWKCVLAYEDREASFEYFTGSGCVKKVLSFGLNEAYDKFWCGLNQKGTLKPELPKTEDLLDCLLLDVSALEQSFDSWCDDFGANSDSLKDLQTYLSCQKNGDKLTRLLGGDLVRELREMER